MLVCGEREVMVMAPPPTPDSAVSSCFQGYPAFSTGISHHSLLPHLPSIHFSAVNSSPRLGIAPHSPTPAPSRCAFQDTCLPVQGMYGCGKDCLILFPFKPPQISSFTLSFKCFSSDSDNCPNVAIRPLLQSPYLPRAGGKNSYFPP